MSAPVQEHVVAEEVTAEAVVKPRAVLFVDGDLPASMADVELVSVTSNTLGAIVSRRC